MKGAAEGAGLPASDRNPAILRLPFMFVTLSTISVNRRGPLWMPRAELSIHGLKAGAATGLEKSENRGVQAARNGPSLPPCVAKAEMSTADRLLILAKSTASGRVTLSSCFALLKGSD